MWNDMKIIAATIPEEIWGKGRKRDKAAITAKNLLVV